MSKVMVRDRKNETGMTSLVLIYRCNSSNPSGYKIDFRLRQVCEPQGWQTKIHAILG